MDYGGPSKCGGVAGWRRRGGRGDVSGPYDRFSKDYGTGDLVRAKALLGLGKIEAGNVYRKQVAAPGYGLDQPCIPAKQLSQQHHLKADIALIDHRSGPDEVDDRLLGDNLALASHQNDQQIEGTAAQFDGLTVPQQQARFGNDNETTKP